MEVIELIFHQKPLRSGESGRKIDLVLDNGRGMNVTVYI